MRFDRKADANTLSTGLPGLEMLIGGLTPGQVIQLAGRPCAGKTSLVLEVTRRMCSRIIEAGDCGGLALFTPLACKERSLARLISLEARVPCAIYFDGLATPAEVRRWKEAETKVRSLKLHIDDSSNLSVEHLRRTVESLEDRNRLRLIILEDVQCIGKRKDLGPELRGLVERCRATILVTSALSIAVDRRADHRPRLDDLLNVGISSDYCDVVGFIWRPGIYRRERADRVELIVAKGPKTGTVVFHFDELLGSIEDEAALPLGRSRSFRRRCRPRHVEPSLRPLLDGYERPHL